jgi:hypothetical protein
MNASPSIGAGELLIMGFIFVVLIVCCVLPFWRICSKAGYPGALALLILVPVANLGLLFFLAFGRWPIEQRLEELSAAGSGRTPPGSS